MYHSANIKSSVALLALLTLLCACGEKKKDKALAPHNMFALRYEVLATLPHDEKAFTEGLVIHDNKILESTGQQQSWIAEVNPSSGVHDKKIILPDQYFGEGITTLNSKIYQLTWTTKVGFIYDAKTYAKLGEFTYNTEGWGLTTDGSQLIMSDGSDNIYFIDTTTFKVTRSVRVTENGMGVKAINELEYINGCIYGNIWQTAVIVKINPATGEVTGRLDLSAIANDIARTYPSADVLNGIAYDKNANALLVTGKYWPKSYLIRLKK